VIADEHQHQSIGAAQSFQRFTCAEGVGEFKIMGFPAKIGDWGADSHNEEAPMNDD
jgi:hypothetical protein